MGRGSQDELHRLSSWSFGFHVVSLVSYCLFKGYVTSEGWESSTMLAVLFVTVIRGLKLWPLHRFREAMGEQGQEFKLFRQFWPMSAEACSCRLCIAMALIFLSIVAIVMIQIDERQIHEDRMEEQNSGPWNTSVLGLAGEPDDVPVLHAPSELRDWACWGDATMVGGRVGCSLGATAGGWAATLGCP